MNSYSEIQQRIGYRFNSVELLALSLTHKSFANENRVPSHNERMEFLGDAVLNLLISEHLMKSYPDATEGNLSRLRAAIVSEPALAAVARVLGLGSHLLLGRGEDQTGGRNKPSLLANSLEALIAAIYLDGGKTAAEQFVLGFFNDTIVSICAPGASVDYKTSLQELCQERLKQLPEYRLASETGPDHCKEFTVEIVLRNEVCGSGIGRNKKEAEQKAAKAALELLSAGKTNSGRP